MKINSTDSRIITIGLLGAPINNENMGCLALTYSLIAMLEEIAEDLGTAFTYYDFEGVEDPIKTKTICQKLRVAENKVRSFNIFPVESFLGFCHRPHKVIETLNALRECDFFIDLTQGDSFADIYGNANFSKNANGKLLIENRLKKPLILGPQTYGPYKDNRNKNKAKEAIEAASLVIARDAVSADYIKAFVDKEVHVTTDLAFRLPYKKLVGEHNSSDGEVKIKVGVNVSGLLVKNKVETTPTEFALKTDYDVYIDQLLMWLLKQGYEVSLVPHVAADYVCCKQIAEKYPQVELVEMYQNPIDVKSRISECDVFIGARMHATIGAFSSGVATIPTAYSRKFNGLYESLQYPYVVDLLNESTEECIEKTIEYIESYGVLQRKVKECMKKVDALTAETKHLFKTAITEIIGL